MNTDSRTRHDAGWTFVEAIIVIAIVFTLSGTVAVSAFRYIDRARAAASRAQIESLRLALHAYYIDTGTFPTEAQGLSALWARPALAPIPIGWAGPYLDRPAGVDAWGTGFVYRRDPHGDSPFEIVSLGADGLPGGHGYDADISSHD